MPWIREYWIRLPERLSRTLLLARRHYVLATLACAHERSCTMIGTASPDTRAGAHAAALACAFGFAVPRTIHREARPRVAAPSDHTHVTFTAVIDVATPDAGSTSQPNPYHRLRRTWGRQTDADGTASAGSRSTRHRTHPAWKDWPEAERFPASARYPGAPATDPHPEGGSSLRLSDAPVPSPVLEGPRKPSPGHAARHPDLQERSNPHARSHTRGTAPCRAARAPWIPPKCTPPLPPIRAPRRQGRPPHSPSQLYTAR